MTALTSTGYDEAAVSEASAARGEPEWLRERRIEAARAFAAMPNPTRESRPWKYTDVSALDFEAFPPAAATLTISGEVPGGRAGLLGGDAEQWPEELRANLGELIPATEGKFIAANAALWDTGVFVHLPQGVACEEPIVIDIDSREGSPVAIFPRLLILAGERSEVTVVLRLRSGDEPLLVSAVIEIYAHDSARVKLLIDERWGDQTQDFTTIRSRLGRDSDVNVATIALGGRLVKQTTEALIEGEGANSVIRGIALGGGDQHFDFITLQDHEGPHTTSDVAIKAALAGSSRSIYYGITRVEETAKGAQANQENRNLLLSEHSKADSDPVLEILTSDVIRCGHAATVGPVDEEALFYLQSRGLDYRASLQLLVQGFFESVIADMPLEDLRDELREAVGAKLATVEL
jgi:Fe-S cluster assembly protein SufD